MQLLRGNQAPIAHAGTDQTLYVGDIAKLDGSTSTDSDGDALSYRWQITAAPASSLSQLSNGAAIRPELPINRYGHYQIDLIVNDGFLDSIPDQVAIDTRNSAPVANAGADQSAFVGGVVALEGGASHDVDGDTLTYRWNLAEKPTASNAVIIDDRLQQCRIAIDKPGHYVARLIVNDGVLDSEPDLVDIDTQNSKPVAHAGLDQTNKLVGIPVELDGSQSSDVDGDALTYLWSMLHQPEGGNVVIRQADQAKATFTPDKPGDYVGQLIINDGQANSDPATTVVAVIPAAPVNNAPKIISSPLLSAAVGAGYSYNVDAQDADGDTLGFSLSTYPTGMTINAQSGLITWVPAANQTGVHSVTVSVSDGKSGSDSQSYSITAAGRIGKITVPEGDYLYGYHASTGKLISIDTPDGLGLDYSFKGALPTQTSWSGSVNGSVSKTYDNDFRVAGISVNGANAVAYGYDADSLLTNAGDLTLSRDAQNGLLTGTTLGSLAGRYNYNGFGEISGYLALYGTSDLYKTGFSRDKLGRISQKIETVGGVTNTYDYGYDEAGRLIEVKLNGAVQASYGYDANGNRTQVNGQIVAHYDDQDRLLDYGTASYAYTANGELKTKTVGTATTSYSYDVLGSLRHVALSGGTAIDYLVDGQNRRIGKKVNGTLSQGFLYQDQLKPVAELDGNGNIIARFVYATAANVPDYMIKGGNTYRIIKDHLGSPRLVVNIADNTVMQEMRYDVWGRVTQDTNPGFQPFGYAGGLYDRDTGLVRFGARDYDPQVGRWTAKDPIGFRGGDTGLYTYVRNNPVNRIDPSGLLDVYGYQSRGGGSGWNTQYQLTFDPLSDNLQKAIPLPAWLKYTLKVIPQIDTKPVGPLHPIKDFLQCGKLDAKLKKDYQDIYGDQQRLTRDEAESFLNSMTEKYPEMNNLYPSPTDMLDQAESNSRNNWYYMLCPE